MKPSSAKAKGRKLQDETRAAVLAHFPELEGADIKCAIMGESGNDLHLSPAARRLFPFAVECKNQEALNIWKALQQAEANRGEGLIPLVVFRRNRTTAKVALDFEDFLSLLMERNV